MSVAKVLRLEDYRGKREQRRRLSEALYGADSGRLEVFRSLAEVTELCDADRAATVWVDEYGPGDVHPHVVLDHFSDRPRRHFSAEPLRRAWELGVPSAIDALAEPGSTVPTTFAISLGSDGMRAWFIVAESAAGRPLLQAEVRDRLMFLAGECAALILHQELDRALPEDPESSQGGFAGWPILEDLEGRESDEEQGRRIAQRFVVARIAGMFADEDFVFSAERMGEQVRRARAELGDTRGCSDAEDVRWHRTLDALESRDVVSLAGELLEMGQIVERREHAHGALELYTRSYQAAMATSQARVAAEAAWYSGRLLRRRAAWEEARAKYELAQRIVEVAGLTDISVHVAVGLAQISQDMGNLPAARTQLGEALSLAEAEGGNDTVAVVHHSLMGLEQLAGDVEQSLRHGWIAVAKYRDEERRTQCMASLAGVLIDFGDYGAAEDAWTLVAHESREKFYLIYAHDALAHIAALRGDERAFEEHAGRCDELGWRHGSTWVTAEVLYYRGMSYRSLGQLDRARSWLDEALAFAEEHRYNRLIFRAEQALESLRSAEDAAAAPASEESPTAPAEVRDGLRRLRQELVTVGA